jgi:flagellar biosynthesis protein
MQRTAVNLNKKKAVALEYSDTDQALRVAAYGTGKVAEKIIAIAQENNLPISEQSNIAETLCNLNLRADLDPEAVDLLSDTLCFLYQLEQEYCSVLKIS